MSGKPGPWPSGGTLSVKTKLFAVSSLVLGALLMGYVFFLCLLLGFLASTYVAGPSAGEKGCLASVYIPFRRWRIHLHHWMYSLWLAGISAATGTCFLSPAVTYGFLGGLVFQGLYTYPDWHVVMIGRSPEQGRTRDHRQSPPEEAQEDQP